MISATASSAKLELEFFSIRTHFAKSASTPQAESVAPPPRIVEGIGGEIFPTYTRIAEIFGPGEAE